MSYYLQSIEKELPLKKYTLNNFNFLAALGGQIEVGTVAPDNPPPANQPTAEYYKEEMTLPTLLPAPSTLDFKGPGIFGPETGLGRSKHHHVHINLQYLLHFCG